MKAYMSPLVKRMLSDPVACTELSKQLAEVAEGIRVETEIVFEGGIYKFTMSGQARCPVKKEN